MIYLTSDLHFNHMNILKYEPESRPFSSIEEMNEVIIQNWNEVVKISDTVYVLGDMSLFLVERIKGENRCHFNVWRTNMVVINIGWN